MSGDTQYVLRARLDREIGPHQGGTFGIVNQDATAEITVTIRTVGDGPAGDTFYLRKQGETLTLDRASLRSVTIESSVYPATIMFVDTDLVVSITALASAVAAGRVFNGTKVAQVSNGFVALVCGAGGTATGDITYAVVNYDPHGFWNGTDRFVVPAGFLPAGKSGIFLVTAGVSGAGPSPNIAAVTSSLISVTLESTDLTETPGYETWRADENGAPGAVAVGAGVITAQLIIANGIEIGPLRVDVSDGAGHLGHYLAQGTDWTVTYLGIADI